MKRSSWKREDGAKGQSFGGSLCQIKGVKDIIEPPSAFNILGAYLFSEKKNGISFNPDFPCNSPIVYHKLRVLSRAFVPFGENAVRILPRSCLVRLVENAAGIGIAGEEEEPAPSSAGACGWRQEIYMHFTQVT